MDTGTAGTGTVHQYRYRTFRQIRYNIKTGTEHCGKFGTTSILVPYTSVSSVRHLCRYRTLWLVRHDIFVGTGIGTASIPVPDTLVCSFRSFACKGFPSGYSKSVCVHLHSESSELAKLFSQTTPDKHPPDATALPMANPHNFTHPSPSCSSFGATAVMLCCSAPPASPGTPLRPSVHHPSIGLVINIIYTRYIHIWRSVTIQMSLHFRPDVYRFEFRLEL